MNVRRSLIRQLMLYEFELSHNAAEATKNICFAKGEDAVDHDTVTSWFEKFLSGCKNLDDQTRSDEPKSVDSEAVLQTIEANPSSSTLDAQRISGELSISQSNAVRKIMNQSKKKQKKQKTQKQKKIL